MADQKSSIITAPKKSKGPKMSVETFMALVEHRPHQSMMEVTEKVDGFHYRLVKNNPHRINYWKRLGYEVVVEETDAKVSDDSQPDRRRVIGAGQLVLMKQPEDYHQMHQAALEKKARETSRGPVESFKTKAEELGVEPIDKMRERRGPLDMQISEDDDK